MSTRFTALAGRDAHATTFSEALVSGVAALKAGLAARAERNRIVRELSAMSDHDLADIGVARSDIARVAG